MKEEMRYVAYDGVAFVYKEDAEYYEISHRLQAKRKIVADIVSGHMRELTQTRMRINVIEGHLAEIKRKLRNPEVYTTRDHIKLMVDRIRYRADLHMNVHKAMNLKEERAKYNQYLSRIDSDIKRYAEAHDVVVEERNNPQKN